MKKSFFRVSVLSLATAVVLGMTACGGGGGGGGGATGTTSSSGSSSKGPFKQGSTVVAYKLDSNGSRDINVTTTTTDNKGTFSFSSLPWSGPTEFVIYGDYLNENTGSYMTLPASKAISAVSNVIAGSSASVNINVLTNIAAKSIIAKMAAGTDINTAKAEAETSVKELFNLDLGAGVSLDDLDPTDASTNTKANTQLLLVSSAILNTTNPEQVMQTLADDMSDGSVDDTAVAALDEVKTQAASVNLQQVAANMEQADIGVTNPPNNLETTLAGILAVDNNISFTPKYDAFVNTPYVSNEVTVDGIYGGSGAVSVNNGEYSINGAPWTSAAGTVANGQKVRVRVTSASAYSTQATAMLTIGGAQKPFSVTTQDDPFVPDTSPNDFTFGYVTGVKSGNAATSASITISGINTATPISIVNGTYDVNGSGYTTTPATVGNGAIVTVSGDANTTGGGLTTVTLTVGDKTGTFKIFTAIDDTTPDPFSFDAAVDVDKNTTVTSTSISVAGINQNAPIFIDSGEYTTDAGVTWQTSGTVKPGDSIKVRATSAATYATEKDVKLTIGNVVGTFKILTKADPFVPDTTPNALPTLVLVDQNRSATVTTPPFTISGINTPTPATIVGGTFDINGSGSYTDANVSNGDIITVTQTTAGSFNTTTTTTLTVGGVTGTLKTTTIVEDAIPNTFSFDTNTSISVGATNVTSNSVTISGINTQLPITVSNGEYDINGAGFTTAAGTVSNGDIVTLRQPTVATSAETPNVTTVTIGNIATTFTTVTLPAAPAINNTAAAPTTVNEDALYTFTPELNATSGSVDSWSITNKPAWATFNTVNGKLEGTPRNANVGTDANISITATNSQGSSTYGPFTITVVNTNDAPTAADVNASTNEDTPATIDVSSAINDVDVGDSVSVTALGTPSLGTVSKSGNVITYTPLLNANGLDSFTYTVADTNGTTATATVQVTIAPVNDAPVAQNDTASTNEDTNLTIPFATLLANDSDVDSNITISAVTGATNGTVSLSGTDVVYAPNANFNGTDTITYTVSDGSLTADANVTITVLPVNDPATITGSFSGNVEEDTTLSTSGVLSVNDNDTNETTVIPQSNVTGIYGKFSIDANGSWSYTLDNNASNVQALTSAQSGELMVTDSFNVTSLDGTASQAINIYITGTDDTAVFDSNSTFVGNAIEDTAMSVNGTVTVHDNDANQSFVAPISDENTTYGTFSITENGNWTYTVVDSQTIQALAEGEIVSELIPVSSKDGSASSDIDITITGTNDAPVAQASQEYYVKKDTNLSIQLSATDVDNDAVLTLTSASATNATVTIVDTNGSIIFNAPNTTSGVLDYTLNYTFKDEENATVSGTHIVHVSLSNPPIAVNDTETVAEDTNTTLNILSNDTDDNNAIVAINIVTQPSHGTVSVENNTTLIYTPEQDYNGADAFQYNIKDEDGLFSNSVADVNITVTAVNDAPVAVDDNITTAEDTNATFNVLINDHDVDNNISDINVTAVTQGANGSVSFDANGTVVYAPNADFNGQDSFVYTINDGEFDVNATVHVTVTPVNDAPVIANINNITVLEDSNTTYVDLNITDVDNNLSTGLVIGATSSDSSTATVVNDGNGTIEITPQANAYGAVTITVNASDGENNTTSSFMFTITAVNDAPVVTDDTFTVLSGATISLDILSDDNDSDGPNPLTIASCTQPDTNGTVNIDTNGTLLSYTSDAGFNGTDHFTCSVTDGNVSVDENVTVNVTTNNPPVVPTFTISMVIGDTVTGQLQATDDENDTLTFTPVSVSPELNATLSSDGSYTITALTAGAGVINVAVSDGTNTVNATYNIRVVYSEETKSRYDISDGRELTSAEFDAYANTSHDTIPADTKMYSSWGLNDDTNITTLDSDYIEFISGGTFIISEDNSTAYAHDGKLGATETAHISIGSSYNSAYLVAEGIMLDADMNATEIATEIPSLAMLTLPVSAHVYKMAMRMDQEEYDVWGQAEDCSFGPCDTFNTLSDMINNNAQGLVAYNEKNRNRILVFDSNQSLSDGNGTVVEVDMTDVHAGNAIEPVVINPNAGTWESMQYTEDDNNVTMVKVTVADGVNGYDKYPILIDAGADFGDGATSVVYKGDYRPAGISDIEYRFNDVALAVIKNYFNPVTIDDWITNVQDANNTELNATTFDNLPAAVNPESISPLFEVDFEQRNMGEPKTMEASQYTFDSTDNNLSIDVMVNGVYDANKSETLSYRLDTDNKTAIISKIVDGSSTDIYKIKIIGSVSGSDITDGTGLSVPDDANYTVYQAAGLRLENEAYYDAEENATAYDINGTAYTFTNVTDFVTNVADNNLTFDVRSDSNGTNYALTLDNTDSNTSGAIIEVNLDDNSTSVVGSWTIVQAIVGSVTEETLATHLDVNSGYPEDNLAFGVNGGSTLLRGNLDPANVGDIWYLANSATADITLANFSNQFILPFTYEELANKTVFGVTENADNVLNSGTDNHFVTQYNDYYSHGRDIEFGTFTLTNPLYQEFNIVDGDMLIVNPDGSIASRIHRTARNEMFSDVNVTNADNTSFNVFNFYNEFDAQNYLDAHTNSLISN